MAGKNEYDKEFDRGQEDGSSGSRYDEPCDEHAWTMFKSEETQEKEHNLNRSYEEGYNKGKSGK